MAISDGNPQCPTPSCITMALAIPTGDEREIITYCFTRGYEYDAIVHFLSTFHRTTMSIRTPKN